MKKARILFLAQLPPPVHGVSTVSAAVMSVLRTLEVDMHQVAIGSSTLSHIGKMSIAKITTIFSAALSVVKGRLFRGRYEISYLTLSPVGDAYYRDLFLVMLSKIVASRTLVHVHTQGLSQITGGHGLRARIGKAALRNTELIAISRLVLAAPNAETTFSRLHYLPNPVDTDEPTEVERSKHINLVCLGGLDPRKGVLRFVECIAGLKSANINVFGTICGADTKRLTAEQVREYANKLGINEQIAITGFVDGSDKKRVLSQADFLVQLTEHDLAPLTITEAMIHRAVPIAFDTGSIKELIGDELSAEHLITGADKARYVECVVSIVTRYTAQPDLLRIAKQKARNFAISAHDPQIFRGRLIELVSKDWRAA